MAMEKAGSDQRSSSDSFSLEVNVLGPLEIALDGSSVTLSGSKRQALLALLAANTNRVVSVERLLDEIWGEHQPEGGVKSLRYHLSKLRDTLQPDRRRGEEGVIVTRQGGYQLVLNPGAFDGVRFETLAAEGRAALAADPRAAGATFREALSLWRGPAYAGLTEVPSLQQEAFRLDELRLTSIEDRIEADVEVGRPQDVIAELEGLVREHPYRERLWGLLMLALYQTDRQAEALAAYRHVRQVLGDELGIEPSLALQQLEEEILLQAPSLSRLAARRPSGSDGLPSGTVTFLFTDVERSTRLWEEAPEPMREAMAVHDGLLTEAIANHGGHFFKNTGDGWCAAFSGAPAAVAAAVEAQLALRSHPWDSSTPMRVRMAVATGGAEPEDGDYHGPILNRTARLVAAGHGGQVLIERTTQELVGDQLPPGCTLRDLGRHLLRDLTSPIHVFQVVHPAIPAEFPSLRSLESFEHNLPTQLTSFVGRNDELAAVSELLGNHRLVTLVGPGGCGKTRLAMQTASILADRYLDGVWFVPLEDFTDGRLVAPAVARAVGVLEQPGRAMTEVLIETLRDRQVLLLLDSAEHLLGSCAELVHVLLTRCEGVTALVTSRELLGVAGERVWRTPPMKTADGTDGDEADRLSCDAVQLFLERAASANPSFELEQYGAEILDLCVKLDGLALAIELAAARLRTMSLADIAGRLDDRLRLLAVDHDTADPRHQTIRATIDWSYDLLTDPEQRAFRQLSVFAKGFDLAAAEAVLAEDPAVDVIELVSHLIDKSLVSVYELNGTFRYGLLETIRSYAREKLDAAGETERTARRQAEFFLRLSEEGAGHLRGIDQLGWLNRMEIEHSNFRAALEWSLERLPADSGLRLATALCWFWAVRGRWSEGRRRLEQALLSPSDSSTLVAKAQLGLGELSADSGATDAEAVVALQSALVTFEDEGLTSEQGRCLLAMGKIASHRGDLAEAENLHHRALEMLRRSDDNWWIAAVLLSLGELAFFSEGPGVASTFLEESLARFQAAGDRWGMSGALKYLGEMNRFLGRAGRGLELIGQSLDFAHELEDRGSLVGSVASSLVFRARALDQLAAYDEAIEALDDAMHLYRRAGNQLGVGWVLANLAATRLHKADLGGLGELLEEDLNLMMSAEHGQGAAYARFHLARYLHMTGDVDRARQLAHSALGTWRAQGDLRATVEVLILLTRIALDQGDPAGAHLRVAEALGVTAQLGLPTMLPGCLEILARADLAAASGRRAAELLGAAVALRSEYECLRPVCDESEFEHTVNEARKAVGRGEFEARWNEGVSLGLEAAIELGLS